LEGGGVSGYYLKLDIQKYYPSINHNILKSLLRKKFKDKDLLELLDNIIDSAPGCPIGNYLSQYFANFYLTYFDHWLKEQKKVKYYIKYMDDIIILHESKEYLYNLLIEIKQYLEDNLKLKVKSNYIISPISKGIDFVGYITYPTHIRLRKRIKLNFIKSVKQNKLSSIPSYKGWLQYGNCVNLWNKYIN